MLQLGIVSYVLEALRGDSILCMSGGHSKRIFKGFFVLTMYKYKQVLVWSLPSYQGIREK